MDATTESLNLRFYLKTSTAPLHSRLDHCLGALDLARSDDYASFLTIQIAAREPIERWCHDRLEPALSPPPQTSLISRDLAALGAATCAPHTIPFAAPLPNAASALGIAWALGGSSLGNRAMLAHLRRKAPSDWPTAFLSDTAMPVFWTKIRPLLERNAGAREAVAACEGATAVFAQFLAVTKHVLLKAAA